ncbi:Signal recognition particle SEC65 subunit [Nosema granulosis]|uniref:Signal recognition particle SEC65 subunit n=1 Tax=Nosema granulosis TaxID=83296 RepID=A0A9P6H0I2_9MICR|nr:Signal recognition particle SEC65 subunit [Nosema granulosis]
MLAQTEYFTLYPVYIDSSKTQAEGRKYSKSLCIEKPNFLELQWALKHLDIECIEEPTKRHPRDYFNFGRFKIKKMYGKKNIIEGLKQTIESERNRPVEVRSEQPADSSKAQSFIKTNKGEVIENKLNLMPRRKEKKKPKKK